MVKLSIVTGGVTLSLEVEDLEITIESLKELINEKMPEDKKIPSDKQILYLKQKKLETGKKLSEFICEKDEGVRIFVLRETKSNLTNSKNPYSGEQQAAPQVNNNHNVNPNPYGGYPPQQVNPYANPYSQPPLHPQYSGYPAHPAMGGLNNFKLSKEMIDMVMNNPALFDQMIEMQTQGMTPDVKESFKHSTMSAFKMLQNDPSILDRINQISGFGNPPPYGGNPTGFTSPSAYSNPSGFGSPQIGGQPPYYGQSTYGGYPPYHPPQPMYNPYGGYPPYSPQPQAQSFMLTKDQYKTQFSQQLTALKDMGFTNEDENLEALIKARGDINYALDLLRKDANFSQN